MLQSDDDESKIKSYAIVALFSAISITRISSSGLPIFPTDESVKVIRFYPRRRTDRYTSNWQMETGRVKHEGTIRLLIYVSQDWNQDWMSSWRKIIDKKPTRTINSSKQIWLVTLTLKSLIDIPISSFFKKKTNECVRFSLFVAISLDHLKAPCWERFCFEFA